MGIRGKTLGDTRKTQERRTDFIVWTCPAGPGRDEQDGQGCNTEGGDEWLG